MQYISYYIKGRGGGSTSTWSIRWLRLEEKLGVPPFPLSSHLLIAAEWFFSRFFSTEISRASSWSQNAALKDFISRLVETFQGVKSDHLFFSNLSTQTYMSVLWKLSFCHHLICHFGSCYSTEGPSSCPFATKPRHDGRREGPICRMQCKMELIGPTERTSWQVWTTVLYNNPHVAWTIFSSSQLNHGGVCFFLLPEIN